MKAATAPELMEENSIARPNDLSFILARRLPHRGILYKLNSKELAEWFSTPANRSNFLEYYRTNVIIKDRSFHVLVENVPISFVPENQAAVADIEKKAGFKPRTISRARYIKPITRCNPKQQTAHVVITFMSKESANHTIKFGLLVDGEKVYGHKLLPKPTRCLKCHSLDGAHIATECPQEHDACGTCGEQHCTSTCDTNDPKQY